MKNSTPKEEKANKKRNQKKREKGQKKENTKLEKKTKRKKTAKKETIKVLPSLEKNLFLRRFSYFCSSLTQ